jgi:hypothetical protein
MVGNEDFSDMGNDWLAEHCAQETHKFYRNKPNDTRYCFELLCRACRDENEAALDHSYKIYVPLLAAHAKRHRLFPQSCQDADSFAHVAFNNFYHSVKGEKFLQKFSKLENVIAYLHACVHTAIVQDVNANPPEISIDDESPISPAAPSQGSDLEQEELWSHICSLLPAANDQLLARLCFVLEMKPAEIVQHYPQIWATPRRVSVALQRIRRRLRGDPDLNRWAGLDNEADDDETENEGDPDEDTDENH